MEHNTVSNAGCKNNLIQPRTLFPPPSAVEDINCSSVYVCLLALFLSWMNCLTYGPNTWWRAWPIQSWMGLKVKGHGHPVEKRSLWTCWWCYLCRLWQYILSWHMAPCNVTAWRLLTTLRQKYWQGRNVVGRCANATAFWYSISVMLPDHLPLAICWAWRWSLLRVVCTWSTE